MGGLSIPATNWPADPGPEHRGIPGRAANPSKRSDTDLNAGCDQHGCISPTQAHTITVSAAVTIPVKKWQGL